MQATLPGYQQMMAGNTIAALARIRALMIRKQKTGLSPTDYRK